MITRMGHIALRVPDLEASVEFAQGVLGLRETLRDGRTAYLTCNERHHELILTEGDGTAYEHIGLEVADGDAMDAALRRAQEAGARLLGAGPEAPGVAGGALLEGPGGHLFRLFHGMQATEPPPADAEVRPVRFEHVSLNVRRLSTMGRFLRDGLGFELSDSIGPQGAWYRCEALHHGIALVRTPKSGLAHYAFALRTFDEYRLIGDRLVERGRAFAWGPGRHGPGDNLFGYFFDAAGAMVECTVEMATIGPDSAYRPRRWPLRLININRWGGGPPTLRFLGADTKPAPPSWS